jgi:hypothetical protein
MACTVFEIFNPVDGKTEGYRAGEASARLLISRLEKYGHIRDFLPAPVDGYYVANTAGHIKSGPFAEWLEAANRADFENMGSDTNTFRVVSHFV